jgi:hypothetical protein
VRIKKKDAATAAGNLCWKSYTWDLEKAYQRQFGVDKNVVVYAEQNNYTLSDEKAREIDARYEEIVR